MVAVKNTWANGDNLGATDLNAIGTVLNQIIDGAATGFVAVLESTGSTGSWLDLTTTTDQVTVTIGASRKALVLLSCYATNTGVNQSLMGVAISGANTIGAGANGVCVGGQMFAANCNQRYSGIFLLNSNDLPNAGSTTFKAKYLADGGVGKFTDRRIAVIPLG